VEEILFLDEIHRMPRLRKSAVIHGDGGFPGVDVVVGKVLERPLSPLSPCHIFTLIGATTRAGHSQALRDRFHFLRHNLIFTQMRSFDISDAAHSYYGFRIDEEAVTEIGSRSRGTPRVGQPPDGFATTHAQVTAQLI
jgi:Holliday junction DNA helicase RuvB